MATTHAPKEIGPKTAIALLSSDRELSRDARESIAAMLEELQSAARHAKTALRLIKGSGVCQGAADDLENILTEYPWQEPAPTLRKITARCRIPEIEPDYGGTLDASGTVHSDADPGL